MKNHIPNTITCCNLISGCIATMLAFMGKPEMALLFIIIGALFDFGDGLSARALGVSSPIGKELDSLADDITFGFAPAAIIYYQLSVMEYPSSIGCLSTFIPFVAFVVAAFSALRLAKFNLDTRQSLGFIGLPTPANALIWGSIVVAYHQYFENISYGFAYIVVLALISSYLLVSEVPMFALKFKHWGVNEPGNKFKYTFIALTVCAIIVSVILTGGFVSGIEHVIAPVGLAYILVSIYLKCVNKH